MKSKNLLLLMSALVCASCGEASSSVDISTSSESTLVTITDGQGRNVTYDKTKVSRVVCVGAGALRYYSYIGDLDKLVGVESIDSSSSFGVGNALRPYYMAGFDTFKELPVIGTGGPLDKTGDSEKIIAADPDIVISFLSAEANDNLQDKTNVPVIGLKQGKDGIFDDATLASFDMLGSIFGKGDRSAELKEYINSCKQELSSLNQSEETFYAGGIGNWGYTSLLGSMINFPVLKYAKVTSAIEGMEFKDKDGNPILSGQVSLTIEQLMSINPDHILMDTAGLAGFLSDYQKEGNAVKYDSLDAFDAGKSYLTLPYNAYYTNLEIQLISTYYVAKLGHSDFEVDMAEKANEVTKNFLGKELYEQMKQHDYGMGGYRAVDIRTLG